MKISFFGAGLMKPVMDSMNKDGHFILYNEFSTDVDVVFIQSHSYIYSIYSKLKILKKHKIKLINLILDIPPWRLEKSYQYNNLISFIRQSLFNLRAKTIYLDSLISNIISNSNDNRFHKIVADYSKKIFQRQIRNRIFYQINYRNFLKHSDLNLSISNYTMKIIKKFLKLDTKLWYLRVNSDLIERLPKYPIKFDAINISRITKHKNQEIFVKAANKLGLKVAVIGPHQDKSIKLNCPHFPLSHKDALKALIQSKFYVDASLFEGFGLTPVEAAFLGKITLASDTLIHKEILKDYPLYFTKNSLEELVEKMKIILNGDFTPNKKTIETIKQKYSIETGKKKLIKYIESLL